MVSKDDVKFRKSNNGGRGGSMSSTDIINSTENNYFDSVTPSEQVGGHIEYRLMYIINDHATEKMEDCDVWMESDNPNSSFSTVSWAIDPIALHPTWSFDPCIYLDGVNDYINCGNHASLWSQSLTKFTLTFWIFPIAAGDGFDRIVIDHGVFTNQGFGVIIDSANSAKIRFHIKDSGGVEHIAFSTQMNLNQWNFIACTYDNTLGSANGKIYVNNLLGSQTFDFTSAINLSNDLWIGDATNDYKGYVKELRWFTNRRLSTTQLDDIFKGDIDDSANADYWQIFGEGTGTPTDEITSKTASLNNGADWRTSQLIPDTTTSPFGIIWIGVTNGPIGNEPTLGDIPPNEAKPRPVWIRWTVADTERDAANDSCSFVVQGKIPQGGTAPPPSGGGSDPVVPPAATDFTFAAVGDWGTESMTERVVNVIKNHSPKPKVVLGLGDNAYDSGSAAVRDWLNYIDDIDTSTIRFETAFGNHDNAESESDSNESTLKNHFGYSNTWNMFDFQNVRFISIDNTSETSFGSGSTQHNKVKEWLSQGRANPNIDWIVVYAHKPMFGGDSKHGYNDGNFNQAYFPMFDQYKVDLMLFGHNHHMAQSKQVKYNSNNAESPTIVDGSTPYTGGAGRIHCIVGTGGHDANDLYEVDSFSQTEWDNDNDHGALFVTISNGSGTTTLTGRFKDTSGNTLRTFVINRTT